MFVYCAVWFAVESSVFLLLCGGLLYVPIFLSYGAVVCSRGQCLFYSAVRFAVEAGVLLSDCLHIVDPVVQQFCVEIGQRLKSGIIPHSYRWPDSPQLCDSPVNSILFGCHKLRIVWSKCFYEEIPLHTTNNDVETRSSYEALTFVTLIKKVVI